MVTLRLVEDRAEILQSLLSFNLGAATNKHLVSKLASRTQYWVYDQQSGQFGSNKFVAYKNMTFATYRHALNGMYTSARHNGTIARHAIEAILGPYAKNVALVGNLVKWAKPILGPHATAGVDHTKRRLVFL